MWNGSGMPNTAKSLSFGRRKEKTPARFVSLIAMLARSRLLSLFLMHFKIFLLLCLFLGTSISKVHGKILRLSREPARSLTVQDSREEFHVASLLDKLESIIEVTKEGMSRLSSQGIFHSNIEVLPFNLTFWNSYPWTHGHVFAVIECQLYKCRSECGKIGGFLPQGM